MTLNLFPQSSSLNYRKDVDGLRALAVMAVFVQHSVKTLLPYGYLGVDIFFVISGFLVSWQLNRLYFTGTRNFTDFYLRRIKRLMPAFLLMALVLLFVGYFVYTTEEYKLLGQALFSNGILASNFYFLIKIDYFDPLTVYSPLLHTWSLAVEEQFYLMMPFLFVFICRKKIDRFWLIFSFLCLVSFVAYVVLYDEYESVVFYMMPFRIWEFGFGALSYFILNYKGKRDGVKNVNLENFLSGLIFFILIGILSGVISFQSGDLYLRVLVVASTAALIVLMHPKLFIYRFLAFRPIVAIGLMSYALYLWHQPVLAVYRFVYMKEDLGLFGILFCFLLTFILAWVSTFFFEKSFRS